MTGPRSLTGHLLDGDRIVRMIFLDAAGLSNPRLETHIVVAGIILNADKQWKTLTQHLSDMADEFAPPPLRSNFVFHATELFSGGKAFPRDSYNKEWRWHVLDELISIPKKFNLPVVWAVTSRAEVEARGPLELPMGIKIAPVLFGQLIAFANTAAAAEHWMQRAADENEIAQMVMENDDHSRLMLRAFQRLLSDPKYYADFDPEHAGLKLSRIIYPMHFEDKTNSSALQVADACAFALKRRCMNKPESERFYRPLVPHLVSTSKADAAPISIARPSEQRPS